MSTKQRKTLKAIFENPVRSDVKWTDIEALFKALGAEISEGSGSRVRIALSGVKAVFHRPHPKRVTDKGALKSVRPSIRRSAPLRVILIKNAGINDEI
jgi:hypothetical protein